MNGVQTRFKCKLDVKRCKRFVFPPSSLLPRSNALKTKAIRYFQTDRTLTRIVSPPLRYILKSQEQGLVTLRDELEFLDSYIYLHQVRLGKCIQLENKMTPTLLNKKIPSLTLQLLIENVIKHNIINMENPMVIHLDYSDKDQTLSVRNKIKLKKDVAKSGMGLKNLSARYLLICNLHITIIDDSEYFTVKIPLLNE